MIYKNNKLNKRICKNRSRGQVTGRRHRYCDTQAKQSRKAYKTSIKIDLSVNPRDDDIVIASKAKQSRKAYKASIKMDLAVNPRDDDIKMDLAVKPQDDDIFLTEFPSVVAWSSPPLNACIDL